MNAKFGLPESTLFGLQYEDSKGFLTFLQNDKKARALTHLPIPAHHVADLKAGREGRGPAEDALYGQVLP